jgi:Ca2+/H+ antiporter, TMEM165/GDT1 family
MQDAASMFEAFAVSTGVVALGEIGDKTQLLALLLAARFRKPLPIIAGIFVATLLNHAAAGALGAWLTRVIDPTWMRWALGLSFLAVAAWMLVPDQADEVEDQGSGRLGVFGITVVAFFLAEMGDKTQIATVMLAAKYDSLVAVVVGTTLGMMLANVPAVLLGDKAVKFVPLVWVHRIAALVFAVLGLLVLAGVGG